MLRLAPILLPQEAVEDAKAYLRIVGAEEDVLVARLMQSAAELCEQFTGLVLMRRECSEVLAVKTGWMQLGATPVSAITSVESLLADGTGALLPANDYALDIDANGDGWVQLTGPIDTKRIKVVFTAGLAEAWVDIPEPLRQGMIRLTAHFYTFRDVMADAGPPAMVTALWRPWRRMRIG